MSLVAGRLCEFWKRPSRFFAFNDMSIIIKYRLKIKKKLSLLKKIREDVKNKNISDNPETVQEENRDKTGNNEKNHNSTVEKKI